MDLPKQFNHDEYKDTCIKIWQDILIPTTTVTSDIPITPITPENTFTITMPPPNRNGSLHMGHQYNLTIQDTLIRYNKLKGKNVLFVPGTDHGGISVENMATKALMASNNGSSSSSNSSKSRDAMTREEFTNYIEEFAAANKNNIVNQITSLGCYCDWNYESYTKSPKVSTKVTETFIKLYNEGLIYKGYHITNYCVSCKTSLSDDEVDKVEVKDRDLYYITYRIQDSEEYITLATTKPETMFGDVAVAVSPLDPRYTHLHGKNVLIPLINKPIPIITDSYVDENYGTGCVKITPAHDKNDYKVSLNYPELHNAKYNIIDKDLKMINTGIYDGVKNNVCRRLLLEELQKLGQLVKTTKVTSLVHKCYRCTSNIECLLSNQYFLKMEKFIEHVRNTTVTFYPERNKRVLDDWLDNCVDWCISRQINWGHRIPIYTCSDSNCNHEICYDVAPITCDTASAANCPKCNVGTMNQCTDVLDTWFSSGLWPFAIFDEKDLENHLPSSVLVTGKDIIFFWVARMIMFSKELYGKDPFKTVFFHGPILGTDGKKMGKSKGNTIDPNTIIKEYGVDGLRFALLWNASSDHPVLIKGNSDYKTSKALSTKLWNLTRYILTNVVPGCIGNDDFKYEGLPESCDLVFNDYILYELSNQFINYHTNFESFDLMTVCKSLYNFIKDTFCNDYLEVAKLDLSKETRSVVLFCFVSILQMLHPLMPFVTETCWQLVNDTGFDFPKSILLTTYQCIRINKDSAGELIKRIMSVERFYTMIAELRDLRQNAKELKITNPPILVPGYKDIACKLLKLDDFTVELIELVNPVEPVEPVELIKPVESIKPIEPVESIKPII